MKLPFKIKKEDHLEEGWEPDINKEYLIQYRWKKNTKDEKSIFLVGSFSEVWYGYTFHWFWGASSIQLSTESYSKDIESFIGIWEVERLPEPQRKKKKTNFITKGDMNI